MRQGIPGLLIDSNIERCSLTSLLLIKTRGGGGEYISHVLCRQTNLFPSTYTIPLLPCHSPQPLLFTQLPRHGLPFIPPSQRPRIIPPMPARQTLPAPITARKRPGDKSPRARNRPHRRLRSAGEIAADDRKWYRELRFVDRRFPSVLRACKPEKFPSILTRRVFFGAVLTLLAIIQGETPLGYAYAVESTAPSVALVPVLRSGLGMLDGRLSSLSLSLSPPKPRMRAVVSI